MIVTVLLSPLLLLLPKKYLKFLSMIVTVLLSPPCTHALPASGRNMVQCVGHARVQTQCPHSSPPLSHFHGNLTFYNKNGISL